MAPRDAEATLGRVGAAVREDLSAKNRVIALTGIIARVDDP